MNLQDVLIEADLVDATFLQGAREVEHSSGYGLGHLVVQAGVIQGKVLARLLAARFGLSLIDAGDEDIPLATKKLVPGPLAWRRRVLPVWRRDTAQGAALFLTMTDPTDETIYGALTHLGLRFVPLVADDAALSRWLARAYPDDVQPAVPGHDVSRLQDLAEGVVASPAMDSPASAFLTVSTDKFVDDVLSRTAKASGLSATTDDLHWLKRKLDQSGTAPSAPLTPREVTLPPPTVVGEVVLPLVVVLAGPAAKRAQVRSVIKGLVETLTEVDSMIAVVGLVSTERVDVVVLLDPAADGDAPGTLLALAKRTRRPRLIVVGADPRLDAHKLDARLDAGGSNVDRGMNVLKALRWIAQGTK